MTASQRLSIEGAGENNLRDLDVAFGPGLTAIVGVSGSGKSSLAFDVVYREARRRLVESLSLASPWAQEPPSRVRRITGLPPAVALGQDSVIRNPASTVATASGIHPFLRLLYARFAARVCPECGRTIEVLSKEERLSRARVVLARNGAADVVVPLLSHAEGSHARILSLLVERFGSGEVEVDGGAWDSAPLDPAVPHRIAVRIARGLNGDAAAVRSALADADHLGAPVVELRVDGKAFPLARAPVCPGCGQRLAPLRPGDFRSDRPEAEGYLLGGLTLTELLSQAVTAVLALLDRIDLPAGAARALSEIGRRLASLDSVGLGYLTLDRSSPTLSRGEAQRLRLAILLSNRVDGVLHVLDEPTIGLDPAQVGRLLKGIVRLRGPVLMVEHDPWAVSQADDVVELGPGGGTAGGEVVFQGTPAALAKAETPSSNLFARRTSRPGGRAASFDSAIEVTGATARNLRGIDVSFPIGCLTVVTGPSGAGKTTLVRDVLAPSLRAGRAVGCAALGCPPLRAIVVDQSPIGRNPRSNPATYTGLASRIRDLFARESGLPPSAFSFNRPEGACPACEGMGATPLDDPHLPPAWLTCESCAGRRFGDRSLAVRLPGADGRDHDVAGVFGLTVSEATTVLGGDRVARRILTALDSLGLGYLSLGQPSPRLSGGEAQRVKLAGKLATAGESDLLVVDEPTTGLHPNELERLLTALRGAAAHGTTVVVVEHHPDVVAAADWVVRLGPGGGPDGGRLLHDGLPEVRGSRAPRPRARHRDAPRSAPAIRVRGASTHNLRNVSLDIAKGAITAFVGVSGSGKSSLLTDVIHAEAARRLLECLSMYERQSVKEGPEASVRALEGLGPTIALSPKRPRGRRARVGTASEVSYQLAVLLAYLGDRSCDRCGTRQRRTVGRGGTTWACPACPRTTSRIEPRHFLPGSYEAACPTCSGLGTIAAGREDRLIVDPGAPLCGGAMHSPGYFPGSYYCQEGSGGHDMLRALGAKHGFDPSTTPWRRMSRAARVAFLNGEEEPLVVEFRTAKRTSTRTVAWRGFFPIVEAWDVGGLYTDHLPCPACHGARLRPEYLAVTLFGHDRHALHTMPLIELERVLRKRLPPSPVPAVEHAAVAARARVGFLVRVGLGYVHLDRTCETLSAGEAQRLKLAALLGGGLTGMTVLLDEPSRGLHPREVGALGDELATLRAQGNTVIFVEHDPELVRRADHVVVFGPGAGTAGGRIVARADPDRLAGAGCAWVLAPPGRDGRPRRRPTGWMTVEGARENNLAGDDVAIPLGVLVGLCGVSGSGKSTLAVDTIGLALAPPRLTTSVAYERVEPGAHDRITGAPARTIVVDQTPQGVTSPGALLGASAALRRAFADSDAALSAGLAATDLTPRCDRCHGRGVLTEDMGFLPTVHLPCDACDGTGYAAEVRELRVRGMSLPETEALTLDEVGRLWGDVAVVAAPLAVADAVGIGHLVLRQPGVTLSGGELQRLKLVKELAKGRRTPTLFVLDEPTVGQHARDVERLIAVLHRLTEDGHTVLVVDHHAGLLAACDWLIELGPGGGPDGGRVVAAGTPEAVGRRRTPTAAYLRDALT